MNNLYKGGTKMAIENNLPIIFDTATQTEDGLMSFSDKIKLDNLEGSLNDKLNVTDKIPSSMLDISSDAVKIQPENLSDAVKAMMTGTSPVNASVANNSITTEKIATNAITVDKIDKRVLLGHVVSPRPLNFAFDTKKVSINIPQGSLFLTDATTKRVLVSGVDTEDKVVNINYPTEFDGLNYIVSNPTGTLTMVNYRKVNEITNTNSIMALVSLTKTYQVSIVMNGNYTINGLAHGIGTESAALMGTGKIVFDKQTGIIDFTNISNLQLLVGGVFNRTIESQASIRLVDYTEDSIYCLYWDNATSSLKTNVSIISNTDTDIYKIALIKDGRIIPFVNTGIYYSKPYIDAPYYTESFDCIDTITLIGEGVINIVNDEEYAINIPEETYVCVNQRELLVKNLKCTYDGKDGLYYILFNLDTQMMSCRHYEENTVEDSKDIAVATFWVYKTDIVVSGNIQCTVNGKTPYQDDLAEAVAHIENLNNIVVSDLSDSKILVGDDIYMIEGEELPIYESSMLVNNTEGIKSAICYNKNNDEMSPRVKFFNGDIILDDTIGDKVTLRAYDKYNTHSYLTKEVTINKVAPTYKSDMPIKILCLGDELIADKTVAYINNKLTALGTKPEMVGTMISNEVHNEGRPGWLYSTFIGVSGRGVIDGKISPQTSKGVSSVSMNPFVREANATDKSDNPHNCYRSTGAFEEKTYYTDDNKDGEFYIFDFANYLQVQEIETPDIVVIAIKPEMMGAFTDGVVDANMRYMQKLVAGIRAALPDAYIALVPQYGACTAYANNWEIMTEMISRTIKYVEDLRDDRVKVLSAWIHMNREFGTQFVVNEDHDQLYEINVEDPLNCKLSESAKIELANAITAFIMNI